MPSRSPGMLGGMKSSTPSTRNWGVSLGFVFVGLGLAAAGIYIGDVDDAPGAAVLGLLLMTGAIVLGVKFGRRQT